MIEVSNNLEERFLELLKILKKISVYGFSKLDEELRIRRFAKKMLLAIGLRLISVATPQAQISLHAQNIHKKAVPQLLAKATNTKEISAYEDFVESHRNMIIERQKAFASALWKNMQENIRTEQEAEKKGKKSSMQTLRNMFSTYEKDGISIDKGYFCASAGLGSLLQTIDDGAFEEYKLILECLTNPNHCGEIIKDFKKYFGSKTESNNIQKTLANIFKKNPYTVCIAFPRSNVNSRSGYHYVTVFSNTLAVDTLLAPEDSLKGKVARFNRSAISNTEDYFTGARNKGYVFDLSEMIGHHQVFEMFINHLRKKKLEFPIVRTFEFTPRKSISFRPLSQSSVPLKNEPSDNFSWTAVGRKPVNPQILLTKKQQRFM